MEYPNGYSQKTVSILEKRNSYTHFRRRRIAFFIFKNEIQSNENRQGKDCPGKEREVRILKKNEVFLQAAYVAEKKQSDFLLMKIHTDSILCEDPEDSIPEQDLFVRIKPDLLEDYIALHLMPGDFITLAGARIYAVKSGAIFLKITSIDELVKHENPKKKIDLGLEDAEEKFL